MPNLKVEFEKTYGRSPSDLELEEYAKWAKGQHVQRIKTEDREKIKGERWKSRKIA